MHTYVWYRVCYVCVCVCVLVCMCMRVFAYMRVYVHVSVCVYVCKFVEYDEINVCMLTSMHMCDE